MIRGIAYLQIYQVPKFAEVLVQLADIVKLWRNFPQFQLGVFISKLHLLLERWTVCSVKVGPAVKGWAKD